MGTSATFSAPSGIAYDSANTRLVISDPGSNQVRTLSLMTTSTTTLAGIGFAGSTNGLATTAARFNNPASLYSTGAVVYVADYVSLFFSCSLQAHSCSFFRVTILFVTSLAVLVNLVRLAPCPACFLLLALLDLRVEKTRLPLCSFECLLCSLICS